MAKYGSNSIKVEVDDSGGTLRDMSQHVLTINGVEIEAIMQESHSFGDAWFESLATGIRKMSDVTLGGLFDDAATTGPDVVFNELPTGPAATTRTLTITWGGTKTTSVETFKVKYTRKAQRNQLTDYEVLLRPTGAVTEV